MFLEFLPDWIGLLLPFIFLPIGLLLDDATPDWPDYSNDDGTGQTGTVIDLAFINEMRDALDGMLHSTTNPTVELFTILNEMVTARGSTASLNARLSTVIDAAGALIAPSTIVTATQLRSQFASSVNLLKNSTFWLWDAGLTSAPSYYALTNATVIISGASEADTRRKVGAKCMKLTWSSGTASAQQLIFSTTDMMDHFTGETEEVGAGMWVYATVANQARIVIDNGNTQTASSYHTGAAGWEWLSLQHTISAAGTKLEFRCEMASAGSAYFSGGVVNLAAYVPTFWTPEPIVRGSLNLIVPGVLSIGDGKRYFTFGRPTRIVRAQVFVTTDPTGAGITLNFEKLTAAAPTWTEFIAAAVAIADGDGVGDMTPITSDISANCFSGWFGASGEFLAANTVNKLGRLNIDVIGSTVTGSNLNVRLDALQCGEPFGPAHSVDFQGV